MKSVFEASTGLDAHMILNLLETYGITGRIEGEYLQGGVGELQTMGFVRVLVPDEDYDKARQIISEWESIQPSPENYPAKVRPYGGLQLFITGIIIGAWIMYWILRGHS